MKYLMKPEKDIINYSKKNRDMKSYNNYIQNWIGKNNF